MPSSSIFSIIEKYRKASKFPYRIEKDTSLIFYQRGYNIHLDIIYVRAMVKPDSLDKGTDYNHIGLNIVKNKGITPGDIPGQYIGKELGGDGYFRNIFCLNEDLDISTWKAAQKTVYDFLKDAKNDRYAWLFFGIEYDKETDEVQRQSKIYYCYKLYENSMLYGAPIEGVFDNISPKKTKKNWTQLKNDLYRQGIY